MCTHNKTCVLCVCPYLFNCSVCMFVCGCVFVMSTALFYYYLRNWTLSDLKDSQLLLCSLVKGWLGVFSMF